jgi:hypothetical protein
LPTRMTLLTLPAIAVLPCSPSDPTRWNLIANLAKQG